MDFLRRSLFSQSSAHLLSQLFIPAVGHGRRRGKAGRRKAGVQSYMIGCRRLFADAVRAVGKKDRRDLRGLYSGGRLEIPACQKIRLLPVR